ncbi:transcriptional regulator, CopG family [Candidatus Gastranaerophilus sp. (ex Termes propinquus)]|nr:transcriptional regulator, CopG family [Candidatus Gastranaerophilus sp. (ex Termes propinquus)]
MQHKGGAMASEQFSMRMPKDTKNKLEKLAKAAGRSKAFIAIEAIDKYIEFESWQIQAIQDGLKDVESDSVMPLKDVKHKLGLE